MKMAGKFKKVTRGMLVFLAIVSVGIWLKPADDYSDSERRELAQFPKVSLESVFSGRFMSDFEDYVTDQFPFRKELRQIKAWFGENVLRQNDQNDYYRAEGHLSKMEYPLNTASVQRAMGRINYVYKKYLNDADANVYYSIIPDKNYFLAEDYGYLAMDYEELFAMLDADLAGMKNIEIKDKLSLDDYYQTDLHWRQENLMDVAETLLDAMGQEMQATYGTVELDVPFNGVYASQSAFSVDSESMYYLTNAALEASLVYNYENKQTGPVYDMEKAYDKDPYEMFLSGPVSLMTIENPEALTQNHLILFRDSFGSSIAPLLVEAYAKITLVDIRYMHPDLLGNYVDFENADVLFLYSTSVLNNGDTFK